MQAQPSNDSQMLVSDSAPALADRGTGSAVEKQDLKVKQLGSKSYARKAWDYNYVKNISVGPGTLANTVFAQLTASELFSVWMKTIWQLNTNTNASIDVKVVAASNVGLTGTYVVGQCQKDIDKPTQNALSDADREIRQITAMDPFEITLRPITNPTASDIPYEYSSINCGNSSYDLYYPKIVFISTSSFASTFANDALKAEFAIWARFSPDTIFTQVGIPKTIQTSNTQAISYDNPMNLSLDKLFGEDLSSIRLVGDGLYSHTHTRPTKVTKEAFRCDPISFASSSKVEDIQDTSAPIVQEASEVEAQAVPLFSGTIKNLKTKFSNDKQTVATVVVDGESAVKISDVKPLNVKLESLTSEPQVSGPTETLSLLELPVSIDHISFKDDNPNDTVSQNIHLSINHQTVAQVNAAFANNPYLSARTDYTLKDVSVYWNDSNDLSFIEAKDAAVKDSELSVPMIHFATNVNEELSPNNRGYMCFCLSKSMPIINLNSYIGDQIASSSGILGLTVSDYVRLPDTCVNVATCVRKQIPTVEQAIADQEYPTIIPEISLFDRLSKFYDPSRNFVISFADKRFKQTKFDLVYSGPNKSVFVKSNTLPSNYFLFDVNLADLEIVNVNDITDQNFIPASVVKPLVVDRMNVSALKKFQEGSKPFVFGSNLRYEGANLSGILGASSNVGSALADLIAEFENGSVEDQDANREKLQERLVQILGKQKMEQLKAMFAEQQQMAEIDHENDMQENQLSNPVVQRAAAMAANNPFNPDYKSTPVKPTSPSPSPSPPSSNLDVAPSELPRYSRVVTPEERANFINLPTPGESTTDVPPVVSRNNVETSFPKIHFLPGGSPKPYDPQVSSSKYPGLGNLNAPSGNNNLARSLFVASQQQKFNVLSPLASEIRQNSSPLVKKMYADYDTVA